MTDEDKEHLLSVLKTAASGGYSWTIEAEEIEFLLCLPAQAWQEAKDWHYCGCGDEQDNPYE